VRFHVGALRGGDVAARVVVVDVSVDQAFERRGVAERDVLEPR
jgi:hypothetical protein